MKVKCSHFRKNDVFVLLLAIASILTMLTRRSDTWHDISISILAGILCWLFCSRIPEFQSRRILRKRLCKAYANCKHEIIKTLVYTGNLFPLALGTAITDKRLEQLCDPVFFREFFNANHSANWYKCLGNWSLDTNTEILFFVDELKYVVEEILAKNYDFDQEAESKLRSLCRFWRQIRVLPVYQDDPVKYISEYLVWPLMANTSIDTGDYETDWIQKAIDTL